MAQKKALSEVIEDYALKRIPMEDRRSWFALLTIFAGFATALFFFLVGGVVSTVAGFFWGMVAALIAGVGAFVYIMLIAPIALREGLSCDLCSRAFGFGRRGSVLSSAVYAFSLILFLAVESAIVMGAMAYLLGFNPNDFAMKLLVYVPLFAIWAILTMFGFDLVNRVALVAVPLMFVFLAWAFVFVLAPTGALAGAFTNPGLPGLPLNQGGLPQDVGFFIALNVAFGVAPLIGVASADFTRYGRRNEDLVPTAFTGGFGAYFIVPILGAMVIAAGFPQVFGFFKSLGLPDAAAGQAAAGSPGMVFVILGSWLGMILVLLSQVKIQTFNAYGASLAVANVFAMGANWKPGRGWDLVIASALGLAFVLSTDVLALVNELLVYLGIFTGSWATIIIADHYLVRRWLKLGSDRIRDLDALPAFNWPGIVTYVVSFAVPSYLYATGALPVPFALSIPMALVLHTALSAITQGRYQREAAAAVT